MGLETNYFSAQLDNEAAFDGLTLGLLRDKIADYYLDLGREECPEAMSITHYHGDDEVKFGTAKISEFNTELHNEFQSRLTNSHYQAQHDLGTAQRG